MNDSDFMQLALLESKKALPKCTPNPPVGCVLVKNGEVVASGFTQPIGGNHAEVEAIREYTGNLDGVTYESSSDIHKDFNFMSKLWSGNAIKGVSNEALKLDLINARKLLQLQLLFGFLTFLSVVISGFVSAHYS